MTLWHFVNPADNSGLLELTPGYDPALGWLSGLLAALGAYALFPAVDRMRSAQSRGSRVAWLIGGAFTMSVGFWGMHWIAMLGFHLPTRYQPGQLLVFASILPTALGCAGAIHVLADRQVTARRMHGGAAVLALGVGLMHATGWASLQGDIVVGDTLWGLIAPLILGYGFSLIALYTNLILERRFRSHALSRMFGSLVFGIACQAMHFGSMGYAHFYRGPATVMTGEVAAPAFLIPVISAAVVVALGAFWVVAAIDARLAEIGDALRESEARSRAVIGAMLDACITLDGAGNITGFNRAAEQIYGYSTGEIAGRPIGDLMNPLDAQEHPDWLADPESGDRAAGQSRMVLPDGGRRRNGETFPVEFSLSRFEIHGQPAFSCVIRDLSQSWAADQQLRRMATAVEHASDAICIMDANHIIQYVNPRYETQTGCLREEVVGQPPGRAASDLSVYRDIWETVAGGQTWMGQVRSKRRDGSVYDEELTVTPVHDADGTLSAYVAVMRDVTRRVALEAERGRLSEALQHASDSVQILDTHGNILYVNPAYEKRTGRRLGEIRGTRPEAFLDFSPDLKAYEHMLRSVRAGRPWAGVLRSTNQDGDLLVEHVTVSVIRDASSSHATSYVVVKQPIVEAAPLPALQRASVA